MTWAALAAWGVIKLTQRLQQRNIAPYMLAMRRRCGASDKNLE
jgi:hypothetical protein